MWHDLRNHPGHLALLVLAAICSAAAGQSPEIELWKSVIPGPAVPELPAETQVTAPDGLTRRFDVSRPRLIVHLPPPEVPRCGAAVIVVPGGGFARLSDEHEGLEPAQWFTQQGVVAFQLVYRTPTSKHAVPNAGPVMDLQKAVIEVRQRAAEFQVDPQRIAVLGFSAGGQTALVAAASSCSFCSDEPTDAHRPNLLLLLYPYQLASLTDDGLRDDVTIDQQLPPTFIAQAADDAASKVSGTLRLFEQLIRNRIPAELHVYQAGGHGYGMRPRAGSTVGEDWPGRAAAWLRLQGFFEAPRKESP